MRDDTSITPGAWRTEEQFYIIWPLVFVATARWLGQKTLIGILTVLLVGEALVHSPLDVPFLRPLARLSGHLSILAGCLTALLFNLFLANADDRSKLWATWLAWPAVVSLGYVFLQLPETQYWGRVPVVLASCSLVLALVVAPSGTIGRILSWAPLVIIGQVSYGVYLWHIPVFKLTYVHVLPHWELGAPAFVLFRIALTALVVVVSYRLIETPALRLKRRFS